MYHQCTYQCALSYGAGLCIIYSGPLRLFFRGQCRGLTCPKFWTGNPHFRPPEDLHCLSHTKFRSILIECASCDSELFIIIKAQNLRLCLGLFKHENAWSIAIVHVHINCIYHDAAGVDIHDPNRRSEGRGTQLNSWDSSWRVLDLANQKPRLCDAMLGQALQESRDHMHMAYILEEFSWIPGNSAEEKFREFSWIPGDSAEFQKKSEEKPGGLDH